MKKGWQTKRLGDVCEIIKGRKPALKTTATNGDLPYLVAKVMRGSKEAEYASVKDRNSIAVEESETIIICDGSNSGEVFTGFCGILSSTMGKIAKKAEIDDDYLRAFLASTFDVFNGAKTGAAIPHLDKEAMYQLPFPFPPLAEQQRIVGLLDEAFEGLATAKANAEKNLQNARALFESHLQSVFTQRGKGWVEKPLGDLCDFLNGFAFKSSDAVGESQTQLVRMGNLYGSQLDLDRSPVFYPDSFAAEHSRYVLEEGDIIMSLTGTTGKEDYGFAVRIPACGHTLLMNQRIMKFDAIKHDIIDDGYFLHYLRSRCFLDMLYPTANGTRQANLSSVTMKLLPVPLRSPKEQKAISVTLTDLHKETQRLARIYEQKLAALEALRKSLLHQAFTGEL
jgi:type I restriction enzyme, S subunit